MGAIECCLRPAQQENAPGFVPDHPANRQRMRRGDAPPRSAPAPAAPPYVPPTGPPPASTAALKRIPLVTVRENDLVGENESCCICLETHEIGSVAARLPCGHLFHEQCVTEWLLRNCTCPVCRFELATDDRDFERSRRSRNTRGGRRVRVRTREIERMPVRALKDILAAAGESARGCVERADLVRRVLTSSHVDVVPESVQEITRSELAAMSLGDVVRLAKRLGVMSERAVERSDVVDLLVDSGRVAVVDDLPAPPEEETKESPGAKRKRSPTAEGGFKRGFLL